MMSPGKKIMLENSFHLDLKMIKSLLDTMKQNPLAGFISGICVIFMILNQFLGFFMFGDPKTTPKVMLIIICFPFPNAKFENG